MPNPNKKDPAAVQYDRWDRDDWEQMQREIDTLPAATKSLLDVTHTARDQMFDGFNLLHRYNPKERPEDEIAEDSIVDLYANREMMNVPQFKELRRFTAGDPVASGQGVAVLGPEYEIIHDKQKLRQRQADRVQQLTEERDQLLEELLEELAKNPPQPADNDDDEQDDGNGARGDDFGQDGTLGDLFVPGEGGDTTQGAGDGDQEGDDQGQGNGTGEGDDQDGEGEGEGQGEPQLSQRAQDLQDQIDDLQQQIESLKKGLKQGLAEDAQEIAAGLARGMAKATAKIKLDRTMAQMCGLNPGELTKLPVADRIELARKFARHSRLAEVARWWGPLMFDILADRSKTVDNIPDEVYDITLGQDLSRLTPAEYIRLDDDDLVWDFLKDFAEGRLTNYKVRGKEKVGRGGIIMCCDGSLSMAYQSRDDQAAAISTSVANLAKIEGRTFHYLHFGGPGAIKRIDFVEPKDWTIDRIIQMIETAFINAGTCFLTPLTAAKNILEVEFAETGNVQSDIVFLTDGHAGLTDEFLEEFLDSMHHMEAQCHGILLGDEEDVRISEPINTFCEGRVYSLDDLSNNGRELRQIFRSL